MQSGITRSSACRCFAGKVRQKYTDKHSFQAGVRPVLTAFGQIYASIDFAERAHAQFRTDIQSATGGSDFVPCAQRLLVRQHVVEHMHRGGADPADTGNGVQAMLADAGVDDDLGVASARRSICPLHIRLANERRHAWKSLVAPDRKMTPAETQVMEQRIAADWAQLSASPERLALAEAASPQRPSSSALVPSGVGQAGAPSFSSHSGLSVDRQHVVDPDSVVKVMQQMPSLSSAARKAQLTEEKKEGHVSHPVCDRTSGVTEGYSLSHGCFQEKKNICRKHYLDGNEATRLDAVVAALRRWVRALTKEQQAGASELLAMTGTDGPHDELRAFVVLLLVHVRGGSQVHMVYFAECRVREGADPRSGDFIGAVPSAYPYQVHIATRPSRLSCSGGGGGGGGQQAISFMTSDEVAFKIMKAKRHWELSRLLYTIDSYDDSLLLMNVDGCSEVVASTAEPAKRRSRRDDPSALDLEDPVAHGRSAGLSSGAKEGSGSSGPMPVTDHGVPTDELADELADMPADVIEDLGIAIADAHSMPGLGVALSDDEDNESDSDDACPAGAAGAAAWLDEAQDDDAVHDAEGRPEGR